ncbi:MAG TPA: sigma-70 family RNA polymerase sigma factor [Thermoanaerobaculia bacterium]|jgi:RNA polymerase sigma-70 factor (ECF subfamily)|nr:sigma-70 family RNA polymerase sigma factor [Thermoanaerobaculia bacterium]
MDASEQALVEAAKNDPARFGALYEAHFERIYAFVARRVRDRSVAEDLTAEVFRHALSAIGGFEWRGVPFAAWLYRIAANEIANHVAKRAREKGSIASHEPSHDETEKIEHRATLFRLVDDLPVDQRRVIVMRFAEERSIREIAADLGRSEGAVKQLQWRALETMRSKMRQSHG